MGVVEVTQPSLGVGYEIAQAEIMGKKMLCIYRNGDKLSAIIGRNKNLIKKGCAYSFRFRHYF